jgi:hypothetical protein
MPIKKKFSRPLHFSSESSIAGRASRAFAPGTRRHDSVTGGSRALSPGVPVRCRLGLGPAPVTVTARRRPAGHGTVTAAGTQAGRALRLPSQAEAAAGVPVTHTVKQVTRGQRRRAAAAGSLAPRHPNIREVPFGLSLGRRARAPAARESRRAGPTPSGIFKFLAKLLCQCHGNRPRARTPDLPSDS